MKESSTSARARARTKAETSGAQRSAVWAAFSITLLSAAGAFGAGYNTFRNSIEDRYGLSVYVRISDDNTFQRPDSDPPAPVTLFFTENSVKQLSAAFETHDFNLASVRLGARVPRVFIATLPPDIEGLKSANEKRATFIRAILPMVLAVNERIAADRRYLIDLRRRASSGEELPAADQAWLLNLADRYKVNGKSRNFDWAALIERVDVVPPSLALAQSIVETGWGVSAPARRSNALFGMIGGDGTDTARLASFDSLYASVAAYVHNLNTYGAYTDFRRQRAVLRTSGRAPTGHALAATLLRYSELGAEYTRHIQAVIEKESLKPFDHSQLTEPRDSDG